MPRGSPKPIPVSIFFLKFSHYSLIILYRERKVKLYPIGYMTRNERESSLTLLQVSAMLSIIYLKPTYLYIKQHTKTGLLYFGKTVNDPNKYHGSGKRWVKHIKKHGKQYIETLWY